MIEPMDPDLRDLMAAWFGTEVDPARGDELIARLRADEAFRRAFVAEIRLMGMLKAVQAPESRWLRLEDELGWSVAPPLADGALEDRVVGRLDAAAGPPEPARVGSGRRWRRPLSYAAAVAAAAGVALAAVWAGRPSGGPPNPVPAGVPEAVGRAYPKVDTLAGLAMAVKLDGVQWEEDRLGEPHPGEGDILPAGRLRIASGRARLTMLTGVVLDVEGPADFDLVSSEKVYCRQGRIRARVPAGAEGFLVVGPSSAIVDLGTEFGVNVGLDGKMRGQVFRGKLEAALLNESGTSQRSYFLDADRANSVKAFEVDSKAARIGAVGASTDFAAASAPADPPLLLAAGYREAVLRSRPWGYWRFEALAAGASPNEVEGKPALRATGPIRLAGPPGGNQSAAFPGDPAGAVVRQFLTMDGSWRPTWEAGFAVELWALAEAIAHASLASMVSPFGTNSHVFLLEMTSRNRLTIHKPASVRLLHRFPPGWEGGDNTYSQDPYVPYRWHHIVGQVKDETIELFVDGVLSSRLPVTSTDHTPVPCQLTLGRLTVQQGSGVSIDRPFVGQLDEVALYDHPLTAAEVRAHHALRATPRPAR